MTGKQLTEYFQHVMELECTIQCQSQVVEDIQHIRPSYPPEPVKETPQHNYAVRRLYDERNRLRMPKEPVKEKNEMEEPKKPVLKLQNPCRSVLVYFFAFVLLCAAIYVLFMGYFAWFLCLLLSIPVLHLVGHIIEYTVDFNDYNRIFPKYIGECARIEKEYEDQMKAYEQAKADYNAKKVPIDKEIFTAEKSIEEANNQAMQLWIEQKKIVEINLEKAKEEVNRLAMPLAEAKKTLEKLYNTNVIYPKYRNLVAVCTIFEYLDSGRCSMLEGPNGAYNLYESELRQNLIISKLDEVIDNMNIIQQNQYQLYKKLDSIDSTVRNIHQSVNQIASNTKAIATDVGSIKASTANIARNSQIAALSSVITAQCAVITAQNTEAIKYISLIH